MANYNSSNYLIFFLAIVMGNGALAINNYCAHTGTYSNYAQGNLCCLKLNHCTEDKVPEIYKADEEHNPKITGHGGKTFLVTTCDCDDEFFKCLRNVKGTYEFANDYGSAYFKKPAICYKNEGTWQKIPRLLEFNYMMKVENETEAAKAEALATQEIIQIESKRNSTVSN